MDHTSFMFHMQRETHFICISTVNTLYNEYVDKELEVYANTGRVFGGIMFWLHWWWEKKIGDWYFPNTNPFSGKVCMFFLMDKANDNLILKIIVAILKLPTKNLITIH